ncbi:MAG TPA: hypothetical protein VNF75_01020 [Candidatus Dormibacteraeota bacterium]|nr:hypothetical protein [Candidatus Dormibacteraeota bacterium]
MMPEPEVAGFADDRLERHLYGDCALLALAVAHLTGWPAFQMEEGDPAGPFLRHVLMHVPDGRQLDAAGLHNTELFKQFSDNESFKKWLSDSVFAVTYENPDAA